MENENFYSFNGNFPQILPDYWKFSDGTVRTDLQEISDAELNSLGWLGPINMPYVDRPYTFLGNVIDSLSKYEWNSETLEFDYIGVDEYELERGIDYSNFWDEFIDTPAYAKIQAEAKTRLDINVSFTELASSISDGKNGFANRKKIQSVFDDIFLNVDFTQEEIDSILRVFSFNLMLLVYTLPFN